AGRAPRAEPRQLMAAGLERVVPGRPPPVEAILDDPDLVAGGDQGPLHHPRPAGLERQSAPRARDDAPGQRVGIDEDLLHPLSSAARGPTSAASPDRSFQPRWRPRSSPRSRPRTAATSRAWRWPTARRNT